MEGLFWLTICLINYSNYTYWNLVLFLLSFSFCVIIFHPLHLLSVTACIFFILLSLSLACCLLRKQVMLILHVIGAFLTSLAKADVFISQRKQTNWTGLKTPVNSKPQENYWLYQGPGSIYLRLYLCIHIYLCIYLLCFHNLSLFHCLTNHTFSPSVTFPLFTSCISLRQNQITAQWRYLELHWLPIPVAERSVDGGLR